MHTLQPFGLRFCIPTYNPFRLLYRFFIPNSAFSEMNYLLYKYGHGFDFPDTGKEKYLKHNEEVRGMCREQGRELLEFEVGKDGWKELCGFLGESVPDRPFPRVNDAKTFNEHWRPAFRAMDEIVLKRAMAALVAFVAMGWVYHKVSL